MPKKSQAPITYIIPEAPRIADFLARIDITSADAVQEAGQRFAEAYAEWSRKAEEIRRKQEVERKKRLREAIIAGKRLYRVYLELRERYYAEAEQRALDDSGVSEHLAKHEDLTIDDIRSTRRVRD